MLKDKTSENISEFDKTKLINSNIMKGIINNEIYTLNKSTETKDNRKYTIKEFFDKHKSSNSNQFISINDSNKIEYKTPNSIELDQVNNLSNEVNGTIETLPHNESSNFNNSFKFINIYNDSQDSINDIIKTSSINKFNHQIKDKVSKQRQNNYKLNINRILTNKTHLSKDNMNTTNNFRLPSSVPNEFETDSNILFTGFGAEKDVLINENLGECENIKDQGYAEFSYSNPEITEVSPKNDANVNIKNSSKFNNNSEKTLVENTNKEDAVLGISKFLKEIAFENEETEKDLAFPVIEFKFGALSYSIPYEETTILFKDFYSCKEELIVEYHKNYNLNKKIIGEVEIPAHLKSHHELFKTYLELTSLKENLKEKMDNNENNNNNNALTDKLVEKLSLAIKNYLLTDKELNEKEETKLNYNDFKFKKNISDNKVDAINSYNKKLKKLKDIILILSFSEYFYNFTLAISIVKELKISLLTHHTALFFLELSYRKLSDYHIYENKNLLMSSLVNCLSSNWFELFLKSLDIYSKNLINHIEEDFAILYKLNTSLLEEIIERFFQFYFKSLRNEYLNYVQMFSSKTNNYKLLKLVHLSKEKEDLIFRLIARINDSLASICDNDVINLLLSKEENINHDLNKELKSSISVDNIFKVISNEVLNVTHSFNNNYIETLPDKIHSNINASNLSLSINNKVKYNLNSNFKITIQKYNKNYFYEEVIEIPLFTNFCKFRIIVYNKNQFDTLTCLLEVVFNNELDQIVVENNNKCSNEYRSKNNCHSNKDASLSNKIKKESKFESVINNNLEDKEILKSSIKYSDYLFSQLNFLSFYVNVFVEGMEENNNFIFRNVSNNHKNFPSLSRKVVFTLPKFSELISKNDIILNFYFKPINTLSFLSKYITDTLREKAVNSTKYKYDKFPIGKLVNTNEQNINSNNQNFDVLDYSEVDLLSEDTLINIIINLKDSNPDITLELFIKWLSSYINLQKNITHIISIIPWENTRFDIFFEFMIKFYCGIINKDPELEDCFFKFSKTIIFKNFELVEEMFLDGKCLIIIIINYFQIKIHSIYFPF